MVERLTHSHDGELAVLLIGMTVNRPWRPDQWLPVARAMPRMITELYANKAAAERGEQEWLGFLGARSLVGGRGPTVVQYWRSAEDIYRYAGDVGREHRPAWKAFYERARRHPDAVGVWHETYAVPAGGHESIYFGTPPMGLGAVTGLVPVRRRGETARERISSRVRPEAEVGPGSEARGR
ncbi:DUF4188 domain-containing protein [Luteipulveratus sp. YIM 133132]|uniref:DUF4188 domain-containing protein n=1 Tax=Luteipulveratus flavus TaxID=3031728 RepID=UPI0023B12BC1|nr:DUF4188 domain-containing protein [Luteipulveratus sp. YIM 133132]MDE9367834.1 DUF4188 domain-containing protein [Luteipulveratus sp. YIM 133132]